MGVESEYEVVNIKKTDRVCPVCEDYAEMQAPKPFAIVACEGACLRGEVAKQAANIICHELAPEKTARVCLGAAFTKDGGQRSLVRDADKVIVLEGCFIECASRMLKGVLRKPNLEVINTDDLFDFDRSIFGVNEVSAEQIRQYAQEVAEKIVEKYIA